ncbi:tail fiber protein [Flavobacterium sp. T12S277]|uniref:tail fiber protein n=1 Tax=Flavobacterium sp. T12S277 TaxID=3402752 RepID=UPI003AE7F831
MSLLSLRKIAVLVVLLQASSLYSQGLPIVGFGDPANYKIDTFAVPGSSGLDLHWYGGIRFGDWTGSNVMRIENGNVGVGVLNPTSKFQVSNSFNTDTNEVVASFTRAVGNTGGSSIVRFGYHNTCDLEVNSGYTAVGYRFGNYMDFNIVNNHTGGQHGGINFATNSSIKMAINVNGDVGIGTTTPSNLQGWGKVLDVAGTDHSKILATSTSGLYRVGIFSHNESWYGGGGFVGTESNHPLHFITNYNAKMSILTNGNVGIGTTKPDSKLTVAGNIHAQEVKVTVNAGVVPDYVFANDYKLKSLEEVEAYIKQNKHLPEIPSASDVEKNGLMLAEMNLSLLKKIEEMTLYMIEQNKKIEKQNEKIRVLEEKVFVK